MKLDVKMQTMTITRQEDKLTILEGLLNNDIELEKIVSDFIDECDQNNESSIKFKYFNILKDKIKNYNLLSKITKLVTSIAHNKPFVMKIPIRKETDNLKLNDVINYLNQPFIPFIPNYSLPAFS